MKMIEIGRLKIDRLIMPFQNKHVYCLLLALTLLSSFLSFPDYEFKVFPVETCPLNKEDWNNSSARLNCNSTRLYYCVPNRDLTSLIEFCYPRGRRQLFMAGNCLELAGAGYLNHFSCKDTFLSGCPDTFYFGDDIFKYPKCLAINVNLRCFDSDTKCIKSRQNIIPGRKSTEEQSVNITLTTPEFSTLQNIMPGRKSTEEQSVNITLTTPEFSTLNSTEEQAVNITLKTPEFSTLQNITTEWNSSDEYLENVTEKILDCFTIGLGNNTVGLNCSMEQQEGVTRVNFKYSTVLVIALSSVLFIFVLVLIVLIRKRKIRCGDCRKMKNKQEQFPKPHADGSNETSQSYSYWVVEEQSYYDITHRDTYDEMGMLLDDDELRRRYPQSCATPLDTDETIVKSYESDSECMVNRKVSRRTYIKFDCTQQEGYLEASRSRTFQGLTHSDSQNVSAESDNNTEEDNNYHSDDGFNQSGLKNFTAPFYDENIEGDNGMSPLKQGTNHRQCRPLPSIPATYEVKPVPIQKRRLRGQLGKPPIPQPRTIIKQQSREPPKPSHPRNYSHQQVQPANETATSEAENLGDHNAVSSSSETSTTLSKKCVDFVVGLLTMMGAGLNSRQLKPSDENIQPENSPLLQNASSDQLKNNKSGSNMPDDVDKDYSERNDDVMNFQNESRKERLCPEESRIKGKDWDANQEKTAQTNVNTNPENWSDRRRNQMEKKKIESAYLEKLGLEQLEREKLENEREDKKRLGQLRLESEQRRLSVKRPFDSREGKEEFWMKFKRPFVTATRFASYSTSTSDRLFGGNRGRDKTVDSREIEELSDDRRAMDSFSRDNRPKRRPTVRFERENDRSSTWNDWKDSNHHVQSDRRKKRHRDRRKIRTLVMDSGHEWKSQRENAVMTTSFIRDNWQGGGNSPNEENMSLMEISYNPGQGPLGSPPDSQRNWDSIAERRKIDSSWSALKQKENRILGFKPQDRLTWNNLDLQPNTWQQDFGTQMTSGHLETRVPVMFLVPQPAGMVLTNTSLAGGLGQTEPRFDAYNSMQTRFRRY